MKYVHGGTEMGCKMENCQFIGFCDSNLKSLCLCFFLQLDNPDEQAAQIRRELDGRLQMADQIARVRELCAHLLGDQTKVPHWKHTNY